MAWDIRSYDPEPDNNTEINGINIGEGCSPAGINDAIRQIMGDIAAAGLADAADAFPQIENARQRADEAFNAAVEAEDVAGLAGGSANGAADQAQAAASGLDAHKADAAAHGAATAPETGTIALRGPGGTLGVGEPTEAHHAATKEYVDAVAGGGGGEINATPHPTPYTVMSRDDAARSQVADPARDLDVTNKRYVDAAIASAPDGMFPGCVLMYSGSFSGKNPIVNGVVQADWWLCDGTNSTPNLVNKFVRGTNAAGIGGTGGADSASLSGGYASSNGSHTHSMFMGYASISTAGAHTHSVPAQNTGGTVLSLTQIPSHRHAIADIINTGNLGTGTWGMLGSGTSINSEPAGGGGSHTHSTLANTAASAGGHTHGVSGNGVTESSGSHDHSVSGSVSTLSAYYALAYIIKK